MIIAFSGTSGSGKSTLISEIQKSKILNDKDVAIKKEDSFVTIRLLKYLLGEKIFIRYKEEKLIKKRFTDILYKSFSALCYFLYPVVVYIEFLITYVWYELLFHKSILIADRYFYDYEVSFKNVFGVDNKFVNWLYAHTPKPYLAFLIDININTALSRNKNNFSGWITQSKSFHENVLMHYQTIAKKHNLLVIDNSGKLKVRVEQIKTYIRNKNKLLNVKRVAISGLDGAGKTTVANLLADYANSLNVKSVVAHFYHENLLYKFLILIGFYKLNKHSKSLYKKSRERSKRERQKRTPFMLAFLRFIDSYLQYLFFCFTNYNKLIIFDRFFYDYLVSFEYLSIRWRFLFRKWVPDIKYKFLLESPPLISYKRKPESVKDFFIECHQFYLKMAKEQNLRIIKTLNKKPINITRELIENIN